MNDAQDILVIEQFLFSGWWNWWRVIRKRGLASSGDCTSAILERQRQEDGSEFETSLVYMARPYLKTNKPDEWG